MKQAALDGATVVWSGDDAARRRHCTAEADADADAGTGADADAKAEAKAKVKVKVKAKGKVKVTVDAGAGAGASAIAIASASDRSDMRLESCTVLYGAVQCDAVQVQSIAIRSFGLRGRELCCTVCVHTVNQVCQPLPYRTRPNGGLTFLYCTPLTIPSLNKRVPWPV